MEERKTNVLIVTGMSGAGKSVGLNALEDIGYFCIDNMPPYLLDELVNLSSKKRELDNIALVMDSRLMDFEGILIGLKNISKHKHISYKILFFDASDEVLVKRFKETRRSHPLSKEGSPYEGILMERYLLRPLKEMADVVIESTHYKARDLKIKLMERFKIDNNDYFKISVMSFGFKYGAPIDVDIMFDVRFLPNPFYIADMRPMTGLDDKVYDYVMDNEVTQTFLKKLIDMLEFMIPQYQKEGKSQIVIGIGCTGGQHRSVSIARHIGQFFDSKLSTYVFHRDVEKSKQK